MAFGKIFNDLKKINDPEKIKSVFSVKKQVEQAKQLGLKRFWKMNNKAFYLLTIVLLAVIGYSEIRNSNLVTLFRTDPKWSAAYVGITFLIFCTIIGFAISFYLKVGIKQDFNTDEMTRKQMKYKGVDWHEFENTLKKEDE